MFLERFERLNALAKINNSSKYLEVGVNEGLTFNKIEVPYRVAIDPRFLFNTAELANDNTKFYEVTSDTFFSQIANKDEKFDLIFLDGLHTFEQTFRDFCSSLAYSHSRTIWLIDDTSPIGFLASVPSRKISYGMHLVLKNIQPKRVHQWMGDVYKTVLAIHDFFPQFSYATFSGHGQTVVWLETRQEFKPVWNSLKKISNVGYGEFKRIKDDCMFISEPEEIFKRIEKTMLVNNYVG